MICQHESLGILICQVALALQLYGTEAHESLKLLLHYNYVECKLRNEGFGHFLYTVLCALLPIWYRRVGSFLESYFLDSADLDESPAF